jgi:voltage-gated potassium channel
MNENKTLRWRQRIYLLLERPSEMGKLGKGITILIFSIIAVNIASSIFETVQTLYESFGGLFLAIEEISIVFFTIEYILRVWVCVEDSRYSDPIKGRLKYMKEFLSIIDLLAFAPAYIPFLISVNLRFLRLLRFFRLFRLFKMGHYSDAFDTMVNIFKKKKEPLFITVMIGIIILVLSAVVMYIFENEVQPDKFPNAFTSLYYAGITLASVGYGDIYPITPIGKMMAAFMSLLAVGLFIMPAGIIASAYYEELQNQKNPIIFCPECNQEFPKRQSFQLDRQDPVLLRKIKNEMDKMFQEQEKRETKDSKFRQSVYIIQKKVFSILEQRNPRGALAISITGFIALIIVLNTLMILLETNTELYTPYEQQWKGFEVFSVIIFTIEYVLRVWSCPAHINKQFRDPVKGRLRFMITPMAIIDLLSFLPFYLPFFIPFDSRTFRVIRLIRILRVL